MQIIHNEPPDLYHAQSPGRITFHKLKTFMDSPEKYFRQYVSQQAEPEPQRLSYLIGEATHTMILEGRDVFTSRHPIGGPINPRTGEEYGRDTKAFREAVSDPKTIRTCEYVDILRMRDSVYRNARAERLLYGGHAEVVLRCEWYQGRIDYLAPKHIVDVKTCANLDTFVFDAVQYLYVHQLAFYGWLAQCAGLPWPEAWLIPVAKDDFRSDALRIDPEAIRRAYVEKKAAVKALAQCHAENWWPVEPVISPTFFDVGVFS